MQFYRRENRCLNAAGTIGRQANTDKTIYKFISREQNAGPYNNVNVVNKQFKNVSNFNYWETTLTYPYCMHK